MLDWLVFSASYTRRIYHCTHQAKGDELTQHAYPSNEETTILLSHIVHTPPQSFLTA